MKVLRWGVELTEGPASRKSAAGCRVIQTARTLRAINSAADAGFFPLVRAVEPSPDVHYMVGVFQDRHSGKVTLAGDMRDGGFGDLAVDYRYYYPYNFPNPYAAYLLPDDMKIGESVWLEDLIEDIVAVRGNQGYHPRLACGPAVWNGEDFDVEFDSSRDAEVWIG